MTDKRKCFRITQSNLYIRLQINQQLMIIFTRSSVKTIENSRHLGGYLSTGQSCGNTAITAVVFLMANMVLRFSTSSPNYHKMIKSLQLKSNKNSLFAALSLIS
jgi:xanthine dehydrogenase iron-sulfur cluster and FAD-binding subunit A